MRNLQGAVKEAERLCRKGVESGVATSVSCGLAGLVHGRMESGHAFFGRISGEDDADETGPDTLYDLASLTKPLATTLVFMRLFEEGRIGFDDVIGRFFSCGPDKSDISMADILRHRAGFTAHEPFFERLGPGDDICNAILENPLAHQPGRATLYSDLGFILLGRILEMAGGRPLHEQAADIYEEAGIPGTIGYLAAIGGHDKKFCACQYSSFRGRVAAGEVSDDNCFFMGGVAGHAGLFGDVAAVTAMCVRLLDIWQGRSSLPFSRETVNMFMKKGPHGRGLGFDHPEKTGSAAGSLLSRSSAGHLGFTGTSFWIDPDNDLAVVLLTNRVHPDSSNEKIKEFRPWFHDRVFQMLV